MSYDMTMMMIVILVVRYARDMVVGYWLLRVCYLTGYSTRILVYRFGILLCMTSKT